VARLREIKGDSSGVNYPGFTPQNNRMERRLARKISVKYSVTRAVNQINLDIKYGEVFGLGGTVQVRQL